MNLMEEVGVCVGRRWGGGGGGGGGWGGGQGRWTECDWVDVRAPHYRRQCESMITWTATLAVSYWTPLVACGRCFEVEHGPEASRLLVVELGNGMVSC